MSEKDNSLKINSNITELHKTIIKNPKDIIKITELLNSLKSVGTWHIIEPLKEILEIPNCPIQTQQKILDILAKIQDPRTISILSSYLDHNESKLRNTAIKSLSLIKNPKITPYLITATKDEDKWVKIFAVHGLVKNASPKVIQPLIELLGDPEEEVRKEVIIALNKLKLENTNDLLIAALQSENRYIKLGVISLLGSRKVMESIESLTGLVGTEDRRLDLVICNSLSQISDPRSLVPLLDRSIEQGEVNNRYMICIQKMDETIIPFLIDIYIKGGNERYNESIEYILSKTSFSTHELILDTKLKTTDAEIIEKINHLIRTIEKLRDQVK